MPQLRAKIAHISDLHFGGAVDEDLLPQLERILQEDVKPDFLVVSGDLADSPLPAYMQQACEYINRLAKSCDIPAERVMVIPGNHDYKIIGNFRDRVRTGKNGPFEVYFRGNGQVEPVGLWQAAKETIRSWFKGVTPPKEDIIVKDSPDFGITLLGFNSNAANAGWATGIVTDHQIATIPDALRKADRDGIDNSLKIAVVHHHPIPIPYVPTDKRSQLEESFMVFYNAGAFLREIAHCGITLVLHGHKHFSGFTDVAYDNSDGVWCKIGVLAAGTPTLKNPYDNLGNEFNVIHVFDDDTIKIYPWYFTTARRKTDHDRKYEFFQLRDVREQRAARAAATYGFKVGLSRKEVIITPDGYSRVNTYLEDCRAINKTGIDSFPLELDAPYRSYLRDFDVLKTSRTPQFFKVGEATRQLRSIKATFSFGETIKPESGSFDIGYGYNLLNGHATNLREFERKYYGQNVPWEFVSVMCDQSADSLDLRATFPYLNDLNSLDYNAEVRYVPNTSGNGGGPLILEPQLVQHDEETEHWRNRVKIDGNSLVLRISSPVPGFVYRIRWNYRKEPAAAVPNRFNAERAEKARRDLIDTAATVIKDPASAPIYAEIHRLVANFLGDVIQRYNLSKKETLDVSLAVFDDAKFELRFVYSSNDKIKDYFDETFTPGEGCAGFTFEKGRVLFYDSGSSSVGYYISPSEIKENRGSECGLDDYRLLITIPLSLCDSPAGVLCIGSTQKASGLLTIFDKSPEEKAKEADYLQLLTTVLGANIVSVLG